MKFCLSHLDMPIVPLSTDHYQSRSMQLVSPLVLMISLWKPWHLLESPPPCNWPHFAFLLSEPTRRNLTSSLRLFLRILHELIKVFSKKLLRTIGLYTSRDAPIPIPTNSNSNSGLGIGRIGWNWELELVHPYILQQMLRSTLYTVIYDFLPSAILSEIVCYAL